MFRDLLLLPFGSQSIGRSMSGTQVLSKDGPQFEPWTLLVLNGMPLALWVTTEAPFTIMTRIIMPLAKIDSPYLVSRLKELTIMGKIALGLWVFIRWLSNLIPQGPYKLARQCSSCKNNSA